ncbi:MAG: phosphoribosylformimino-5-aminoimidazole carboxamide ribotide isomerase [Akkermansiaceae bacterium]|nr:phosphoribosylformimino-5-aminoimidazole carboxamide ribotide isomerase [Akkermansiaceae bacterium]
MTNFRPCIDLHEGRVKQIVGGTLQDYGPGPQENFVSDRSAGWFAEKFRGDRLEGGHLIMLGPGNEEAAREALRAWPGGLQVGGGIDASNAAGWLEAGASHVIVTSGLFDREARFRSDRLEALRAVAGAEHLVIDLSSRRTGEGWTVAMNRWQTLTDLEISPDLLDRLAPHCSEFLIHAADVEGKCGGIDGELVALLGQWDGKPVTYAGGVATIEDLLRVEELSGGRVDVTVGSALDLFGGSGVSYAELLEWNAGKRP